MAGDEIQNDEELDDDELEEEVDEPTDIEILAKEMGWNKDYSGGDREYVDARTFILRSKEIQNTMRDQIKTQNAEIKDLGNQISNTMKQFQEHQVKVHKAEVAKLESEIGALKRELKEAVRDSDEERADEIQKQIDAKKAAANVPPPVVTQEQKPPHPLFKPWLEKNPWYQTNEEMKAYADALYANEPGLPYDRVLKHIDKKMREHFPEQFESENRGDEKVKPKAPPAEGGDKKTKKKKVFTYDDLSPSQKEICDAAVKMKATTVEKYIEGLVTIGELK